MTRSPVRDSLVGVFMLMGLGALAYLSLSVGGLSFGKTGGLEVYGDFDELGGLKTRAPVVISGVKVGQVSSILLNENFRARVTMNLDDRLKLPVDTSASIMTSGLLGDRYISLQVGGEDKFLKPGDQIGFTESAVVLERLIGKFIHNAGVSGSNSQPEEGR